LYDSGANFIYELLQNADDNHFIRARGNGFDPRVSFRIHPDRVIVECNEDGFTEENFRAICAIGQSTKSGAQGYIGGKGIGFKSVFMVASKVQIQSGNFSFYFKHQKNDPDKGMGMIRPIWVDREDEELARPLTRFTLFLHDVAQGDDVADVVVNDKTEQTAQPNKINDEENEANRPKLSTSTKGVFQQFRELEEIVLLFLKNIKQLDVSFLDKNGNETSATTFRHKTVFGTKRVRLEKHSSHGDYAPRVYHVETTTVFLLPKNERRPYSQAEEASKLDGTSEISLAFPISEDSDMAIPILEPQQVFAFMPLQRMGFNVSFTLRSSFPNLQKRADCC
jgi:hypothetical protein